MKYKALVYVCSEFIGSINCDSYDLKPHPCSLDLFDWHGDCVGHIEPFGNLIARVDIYDQNDMENRKVGFTIGKTYIFRHDGPIVIRTDLDKTRRKGIESKVENHNNRTD